MTVWDIFLKLSKGLGRGTPCLRTFSCWLLMCSNVYAAGIFRMADWYTLLAQMVSSQSYNMQTHTDSFSWQYAVGRSHQVCPHDFLWFFWAHYKFSQEHSRTCCCGLQHRFGHCPDPRLPRFILSMQLPGSASLSAQNHTRYVTASHTQG